MFILKKWWIVQKITGMHKKKSWRQWYDPLSPWSNWKYICNYYKGYFRTYYAGNHGFFAKNGSSYDKRQTEKWLTYDSWLPKSSNFT